MNLGGFSISFVSVDGKNLISVTPLRNVLNALVFALDDSAKTFVALSTKEFKPAEGGSPKILWAVHASMQSTITGGRKFSDRRPVLLTDANAIEESLSAF